MALDSPPNPPTEDPESWVAQDLTNCIEAFLDDEIIPPLLLGDEYEDLVQAFFQGSTASPLKSTPTSRPTEPRATRCEHDECHFNGWKDVYRAFECIEKHERVRIVRCMLYATTAPHGEPNQLAATTTSAWWRRKRARGGRQTEPRSHIIYAIIGKHLCRAAFANVVCFDEQTLHRHANRMVNGEEALVYETKKKESGKGKFGVQRLVVLGFLRYYGDDYALECPRGRGSREEQPLRILPVGTTKCQVHEAYVDSWAILIEAALNLSGQAVRPSGPLSYSLFVRNWHDDVPTLPIGKGGSDFCDFCTTTRGIIQNTTHDDGSRAAMVEVLERHRHEAKQEFVFYKQCQRNCQDNPTGAVQHVVFDFAEKVLLPKLLKQPGQLHFITGLKFDIFGVSSSNQKRNFVFGLPEGHWPNEKTANCVVSMLHHVLERGKQENADGFHAPNLQLHADNCAGQNKNRFVLWYLCWRTVVGLHDNIDFYFLVAGHTKNVCDGAFGHVKRRLRQNDARTPRDMMHIIEESSDSTTCIPSVDVSWSNWKNPFSKDFKMPSVIKISKYHIFSFCRDAPGVVQVRSLTSADVLKPFTLLDVSKVDAVRQQGITAMQGLYKSVWPSLAEVSSAQHVTRKNYLTVNVLERYYSNDDAMKVGYFENGL